MSDEITPAPAAAAPEAATPEISSDFLSDKQLTSLFGEDAIPATVETKPVAAQASAVPAVEGSDELDTAALDELDKPEPISAVTPAASPDSEYLKIAQQVFPNREVLGWAVDSFQRTTAAATAANAGNIAGALDALPFMKPVLERAVTDYIAANEQRIIENFIRKNSPESQTPEVVALRGELDQIKQHILAQQNAAQTHQQQQALAQQAAQGQAQVKAIETEVSTLLDKVRFTKNEADRSIVSDLVKVAISKDPRVFQAVMAGNLMAMRPALASVVKTYIGADKARKASVPGKQSLAPILTGAGSAVSGDTPDVWGKAANRVVELSRASK